jgi:transcriptional regulator with XRE-family HTH domain
MSVSEVTQGEEIRKLRDKAGLTQKQAAERLDMNERTYGSYERDERDISYKQMQKIRRVLGGRVDTSVTRSYDKNVGASNNLV